MEQMGHLGREPLVFLPGMMSDSRVLEPQIAAFSGHVPVTVAPLRGGETIETIAEHVLQMLPQRFALAGLSMGGIVAMEILRRAPERVTRLCLMATSPLPDTPVQAAEREPMIISARTGRLEDALRRMLHPEYLAPSAGRIPILNQVYAMGMELGHELFVAQTRALQRRRDQQGTLRRCHVPTLILCGAFDRLTPVKRHEFLAELIPNAALQVIDEAGHLPTLERPQVVNRALMNWLDKTPQVYRHTGS